MLTLNDGRSELWQWDTNRKLTVDADCSQVHFSNKVFGRSIDVDVADGMAIIPDILLQSDKELTAWAFVGTAENGYTKISKAFKVNRRNKPADYVFTPHDQTTLGEIVQRLEQLEAMQDPDAIRDAVDEYLANNPIEVEETDPTVPDWAKQPEPPKVEIPEVNVPTTLPNPYPLHFTGAVEATYDGSVPVEVVIPQGGGGDGAWKLLSDETVTEDVTEYRRDFESVYRIAVLFYTPAASANSNVSICINNAPHSKITAAINKLFSSTSAMYMLRPPKAVMAEHPTSNGAMLITSTAQLSSLSTIGSCDHDITSVVLNAGTVYAGTRIVIYGEEW